jgi:peptidoglycan hydrolase-like protein with peptidoglycan-binding domain
MNGKGTDSHMSVRIDYHPEPAPRRSRRRGRVIAVTVAAGALALALAGSLHLAGDDPAVDTAESAPGRTAAAADELPWGDATAAAGSGSRFVSGLPRGFEGTEVGAVEAVSSFAAAGYEMHRMDADHRWAYVTDAVVDPPDREAVDADAAAFQARHGLSATGQLLDGAGQVSATERFTSRCHPGLGTYRVVEHIAEQAVVDLWMPCLLGRVDHRGTPVEVGTQWQVGRYGVAWQDGDWRITGMLPSPYTEVVTPAESGEPATELAERVALLEAAQGPGWQLFADASTERPAEARAS